MVEEISLRDVGNEQIYDSYMGILRISPSKLDNQLTDSMSLFLSNPITEEDSERQAILSDSDGTKIGAYFTTKVRTTKVKNASGKEEEQDVINVVTHATTHLFSSNSLNIRSTLIVNKENQEKKISPIQIYHESESKPGIFDVLLYPIDSPNDASYFNAENKLNLIDYNNSKDVHTQLNEALYNQPKSWYDSKITSEHQVKIGNDFIYTQNKFYEQVPILYTKDYILGQYRGHTARVTDDIKTKLVDGAVGPERLENNNSLVTKLSFIRLDSLVWDVLHEALEGDLRHSDGRYSFLGIGENESISERLFNSINPPAENAPILGTGISPGIVMNHVMPFRRFIFHVLRQEVRNSADEGNNYQNLRNGVKQYVEANKITPVAKLDPGFVNPLTKEFVICDGKELTYENYPSINTDNKSLFQHNEKGVVKRDANTKKPLKATTKSDIYNALAASNNSTAPDAYKGKVVVPSLLALNQKSPRYIRGLNWIETSHENNPDKIINFSETLTYKNNDKKHEVVLNSDYGLTQKNFVNPGVYRAQVDWKACEQHHKHRCFYNSASWNRDNPTKNNYGEAEGPTIKPRPFWARHNYLRDRWYVSDLLTGWVNEKEIEELTVLPPIKFDILEDMKDDKKKPMLMDYSFTKHASVNGQVYQNAWQKCTPVPFAGLFAWKVNGSTQTVDTVKNNYVIQNSSQTAISSTASTRLNQLEQINFAEALAPISNKGGYKVMGITTFIGCTRKHHARTRRYRENFEEQVGAYNILRTTASAKDEIPRCVTSLPVMNPDKKASNPKETPYKMKIGNVEVTPDMDLSFPPTTVLLPLFKI